MEDQTCAGLETFPYAFFQINVRSHELITAETKRKKVSYLRVKGGTDPLLLCEVVQEKAGKKAYYKAFLCTELLLRCEVTHFLA